MADKKAHTSEAEEVRDSDEVAELRQRMQEMAANPMHAVGSIPIGANGRPMARVIGACSDKVPSVQFGNVVIGPIMIERWIEDDGGQGLINESRATQRFAQYVCGVERRLFQWAIDPSSTVASPITAEDAFAAPPPGYDPSSYPDPRDASSATQVAVNHVDPAASQAPSPTPATDAGQGGFGQPPTPPQATVG